MIGSGPEYKFIQQIIKHISYAKSNSIQLFEANHPVGVNSRAEAIESLLDIKANDVRMVGIHGLGGIGKTTIAKVVYNRIFEHFEGKCFLENVRDNSETNDGMIQLQEKLLSNILGNKHLKVLSVAHGTNMIVEMLLRKRILVILDDVDITDKSITERARMGIGFAFQQPVRFKGLTVFDLLKIASGKKLNITEACEYLSEVGLCAKDYINREVNASLSGGELKRIEIATVLARDVKLALFDEPEAGIDLWSFQNLIRIFENMRNPETHRTIIVISHQERILNIADRIIVLADGQVLKEGTREEILPEIIGTRYALNACQKLEG